MKLTSNSGSLPKWMNEFIDIVTPKKTAEKNVQNLPKVIWKDETFFVDFNNGGAVLYNQYGNEVRMVEHAKSIEDVNKFLNENSVVASVDGNDSTDSQDQVEPIELVAEFDLDGDMTTEDGSMEEPTMEVQAEIKDELESYVSDNVIDDEFVNELERVVEQDSTEEPSVSVDENVHQSVEDVTSEPHQNVDEISGEPSQSIEDVSANTNGKQISFDDYVTKANYNRLLAKVNALEKKLAEFGTVNANEDIETTEQNTEQNEEAQEPNNDSSETTEEPVTAKKRLVALVEQQYARTEIPNDMYDLNSQELEVNNFQESAELSQSVIDAEHELDLSNMNDRVKLNSDFLKELLSIDSEPVDVTVDVTVDEETAPVVEESVTVEEPIEETVVENVEEPVVDETVDVSKDDVEDVANAIEEVLPNAEVEIVDMQSEDENKDNEEEFEELDEKSFDKFSKRECPSCSKKGSLTGVKKVASVVGVVCNNCGKEYAVTNEHKVFCKK